MQNELIPAMGSPFSLGYLYNRRTNDILNKSPLSPRADFKPGGLAILTLPQDCTRSSLQEDELRSEDDDFFHLEMSLKVLTIGGSMLYEQSSRNTLEKGSFSYSLTKTTKTKMLSMDHFKFLFEDEHAAEEIRALIESGEATHIISGITYGSQAKLTFQKTDMTRSEGLKAEGAITAEINLFVAAIGAEISFGMENRGHNEEHFIQCGFMGNYTGISIPTTLQEAARVVSHLSSADHPEVPITIFLTPLASLRHKSLPSLPNLSMDWASETNGLVDQVEQALSKLKKLQGGTLAQISKTYETSLQETVFQHELARTDLKKVIQKFLSIINPSTNDLEKVKEECDKLRKNLTSSSDLNELDSRAHIMNTFVRAVKDRGLKLARNDSEARIAEMRMPVEISDQVILQLNFASSPLDSWPMGEAAKQLAKLSRIQKTNPLLACSVRLKCDQKENSSSMKIVQGQEETEVLPMFTINNLRIEGLALLCTIVPANTPGKVEIRVNETVFPIEDNQVKVHLEELGLKPNQMYEVQARAVSPQGLQGFWLPDTPLKLLLPPGVTGVCSSSVLDDNYFRYGPQHVLLPGPATFNSKSEEATWLEIRLDKKTFLAGLLLLCSQDAQPIQAILLPDDGLRSGGSSIFQTKTQ